jgi:ankyrin repeat protein
MSLLAKATSEWRVLNELLQHEGINLDFRNSDGRTSIFFAVGCRSTDSLRLLINKGALLDWMDNEGRTSLSLAAELGHLDHVRILVESNADIDLPDSRGWTPLFWAVSRQHLETAKYLLSIGDVNSGHQDVSGRTPYRSPQRLGVPKVYGT